MLLFLRVTAWKFQHTAARRRLLIAKAKNEGRVMVSTHSRAEAAAKGWHGGVVWYPVSTHSRAEAAAAPIGRAWSSVNVSTHSRAEAAATNSSLSYSIKKVSTHSRAEAAAKVCR